MSKVATKVRFAITWRCLAFGVLVIRRTLWATTIYIGLPFVMIEIDRRSNG